MNICKECGRPTTDLEFERRVTEILGPNMKLYDFGNGIRLMPKAEHNGNEHLRIFVYYLYEMIDGEAFFMPVELERANPDNPLGKEFLETLPTAKAEFERRKSSAPERIRP